MINQIHQSSTQYDSKLISRLFFSLMPAAILICATGSINSIVDGIIASNVLGETAISAIGFFGPVINFLNAISTMLMGGALILIGEYLGKGKGEEANLVFSTDLLATFVIIGGISAFSLFFAPLFARFLGARGET